MVSTRIPWDLHARLQARAARSGLSRSEAIRKAIASWVASEPEIRPHIPDVDLADYVSKVFGITYIAAKVAIRVGRVKVDGEVTRDWTVPPPGPGGVLNVQLDG